MPAYGWAPTSQVASQSLPSACSCGRSCGLTAGSCVGTSLIESPPACTYSPKRWNGRTPATACARDESTLRESLPTDRGGTHDALRAYCRRGDCLPWCSSTCCNGNDERAASLDKGEARRRRERPRLRSEGGRQDG